MSKELIGYVSVDSGQVCIIDPCYVEEWGGYPGEGHYAKACEVTLGPKGAGAFFNNGHGEHAVVSRTRYGDGRYPAYINRNKKGEVTSLIVHFS